jgi:hypothetical protein
MTFLRSLRLHLARGLVRHGYPWVPTDQAHGLPPTSGSVLLEDSPTCQWLLTVKIRQPSHEFTFGVGMSFIPYPLVLTPVV